MKKLLSRAAPFLMAVSLLGSFAGIASAQTYIHANGGSYWTQWGTEWHTISNDGYCVAGRGPCGSSLWYLQWSYNHSGCGYNESALYNMASVVKYNGSVYAWIDSSTGNMYGANYTVSYNYASSYGANVNQSSYYEAWAPIATGLYRISNVLETDGWSTRYICNGVGGKQVEFDEVKLEI